MNTDYISTQKNPYLRMLELFKMKKVIIYIKNVEVFADEARQVFLYTFFDTINNFSGNVMVLLATSNIFFVDKLEKRVKSRFSYTAFNFYNIGFEQIKDEDRGVTYGGLIDILKSKFDTNVKRHKVFSEIMKAAIDEKCIKDLFKKYHIIGMSIEWFLQMIRIAIIFVNQSTFIDIYHHRNKDPVVKREEEKRIDFKDNLTQYIFRQFQKASKSLNCEFES